ncbi:MAG TPA: hypothetical protein VGB51_10085 [Actinomycetota bacterium]
MRESRDPRSGRWSPGRRAIRIPDAERDYGVDLDEYAEAIEVRLRRGIRALEQAAGSVMNELAEEVRRARSGEGGGEDVQPLLADEVSRGMLAHTDERFQSLSIRLTKMEDLIRQLAEATRDAVGRLREKGGLADPTISGRLDSIEGELRESRERAHRHAEALSQRTGKAVAEVTDRVKEGLKALADRLADAEASRIEHLEQSLRSEIERVAETAGAGSGIAEAAAGRLDRSLAEVAERTGAVLDGIREEARAGQQQLLSTLVERTDALDTELRDRLDRIENAHRRQREELAAFTHRVHDGLTGVSGKIHEGFNALAEETRTGIERAGDSLFERTAEIERVASSLAGMITDVGQNVERVATSQDQRNEQLAAYTQRVHVGLTEVTERIQEGFRTLAERTGAASGNVGFRIDGLEELARSQREQLAAYTQRVHAGLTEVARRIQEGFRTVAQTGHDPEAANALQTAIRGEVQSIHARVDAAAGGIGQLLDGVRAEIAVRGEAPAGLSRDEAKVLFTELTRRQVEIERRSLEAVTTTIRELAKSLRAVDERQTEALGRLVRKSAVRQEAVLGETLAALRTVLQDLGRAYARPDGSGGSRPAEGEGVGRRLRGVEHRLEELSKELTGPVAK